MANTVLLSSESHRNVRIDNSYSQELGDGVMYAPTFSSEFRTIQAHYPILFAAAQEDLVPVALFGLERNENLFLTKEGWDCGYVPLMMQRIPFSIGVYGGDEAEKKRLINIDLEHPKATAVDGFELFNSQGNNTEYLDKVANMLETIHQWSEHDKAFMAALKDCELLESVTIGITLEDGSEGELLGFHTVNEKILANLGKETLDKLHKSGFLEPIYMVIASLSNVKKLVERKSNKK